MIPLVKRATTTWNLEWMSGGTQYNSQDALGTKDEIGMWEFSGLMKNTMHPLFDPHPFGAPNELFTALMHVALEAELRAGAYKKIQEGDQIAVINPNPNGPQPRFSVEATEKVRNDGRTVMVRKLTPLA